MTDKCTHGPAIRAGIERLVLFWFVLVNNQNHQSCAVGEIPHHLLTYTTIYAILIVVMEFFYILILEIFKINKNENKFF